MGFRSGVRRLIAVALAGVILGPASPGWGKDLQIAVDLSVDSATGPGASGKIILSGKSYPPNSWFDDVTAAASDPDEIFVMNAVITNQKGTAGDVLRLFPPDEQVEMSKNVMDRNQFDRNRYFYERITRSAFLARVQYRGYTLFFVQHDSQENPPFAKIYPLRKVGRRYHMTNRLASDPVFRNLCAKVLPTLPLNRRK